MFLFLKSSRNCVNSNGHTQYLNSSKRILICRPLRNSLKYIQNFITTNSGELQISQNYYQVWYRRRREVYLKSVVFNRCLESPKEKDQNGNVLRLIKANSYARYRDGPKVNFNFIRTYIHTKKNSFLNKHILFPLPIRVPRTTHAIRGN